MQNTWVTLGLVALVLVLLVLLWMRRPRRHRPRASLTVEQQVAGFRTRDAELLESLRARGVDLNTPRHIDLHFLADTEASADALMRSLGTAFPDGKLERDGPLTAEGSTYWSVTCVVQAAVSAIVQPEAVERRVRLAVAAGADHDGWGTPIK